MGDLVQLPPAGNGAAVSSTPPAADLANQVRGCILMGPRDDLAPMPKGAQRVRDYVPVKSEIVRLDGGLCLVRHFTTGEAIWTRAEGYGGTWLYRRLHGRR